MMQQANKSPTASNKSSKAEQVIQTFPEILVWRGRLLAVIYLPNLLSAPLWLVIVKVIIIFYQMESGSTFLLSL